MKLAVRVSGVEVLRRKFTNVAECAVAGTITRRGLTEAARIVTRAQKNFAPVRKGRVRLRELDKQLKLNRGTALKGLEIGKITKKATVAVVRRRKKTGEIIKPGLIRRSIGFRVKRVQGNFVVQMGMNVGKKRSNTNHAPHAAFVGKAKIGNERFSFRPKAGQIGPNKISRGRMPANMFIPNATRFAAGAAIAALDKAVKEDTVRAYKLDLRAVRNFAEAVG